MFLVFVWGRRTFHAVAGIVAKKTSGDNVASAVPASITASHKVLCCAFEFCGI
jgi:hypothetical protein